MKTQRFLLTVTVGMLMLSASMVLVSRDGAALAAPPVKDTSVHTPAWSQDLPASERFVLESGGAAVLDRETGLVWEQSPATSFHTWSAARSECTSRTVGSRKGWRVPSVHELASLVDPTNPSGNPDLPVGHPFSNVLNGGYWSASRVAGTPSLVWAVHMADSTVFTNETVGDITVNLLAWCVRGGMNANAY